jgi:hypothetical protein
MSHDELMNAIRSLAASGEECLSGGIFGWRGQRAASISRQEIRPFFPSFVKCSPSKSPGGGNLVVSHWNPQRTSTAAADYNLGQGLFS